MSNYREDQLVERPVIQFMQHELGWDVVDCYGEWNSAGGGLGRDGKQEVVLTGWLKPALRRLNTDQELGGRRVEVVRVIDWCPGYSHGVKPDGWRKLSVRHGALADRPQEE